MSVLIQFVAGGSRPWKEQGTDVGDSQTGIGSVDRRDSTLVERKATLGKCHAARVGFYRGRLGGFVLGFW